MALNSRNYPPEHGIRVPAVVQQAHVTDLLGAALEELEASLPYRAGKEVIAVDEMGDPLYKDEGPTPRYLELSRKHLQELVERQQETQH